MISNIPLVVVLLVVLWVVLLVVLLVVLCVVFLVVEEGIVTMLNGLLMVLGVVAGFGALVHSP